MSMFECTYINLMCSCEFTNLIIVMYSKFKRLRIIVKLYHRYTHILYTCLIAYMVCIIYDTIRVWPIILVCCSAPKFYLLWSLLCSRIRIVLSLRSYVAICIQICANEPLQIADNSRKTVLLECIHE